MNNLFFVLLLFGLLSCGEGNEKTRTHNLSDQSAKDGGDQRIIRTSSGKDIIISEGHPNGASLSDIKIHSRTLRDSVVFVDADPVSNVLKGDLNRDGSDEVYVITMTAGSGSYANVIGAVADGDSVLKPITFPAFDPGVKSYEGYMGSDVFSIVGDQLVRRYPRYKKDDVNKNPTGDSATIKYRLIKKGKNFLLLETNS